MKLLVIIKENNLGNTTKLRRIWKDFHVLFYGVAKEEVQRNIENEQLRSLYYDGFRSINGLDRDYLLISDETEMFRFVKEKFHFEYLLYTGCLYPMDFEKYYNPNCVIKIKKSDSYIIPYKLVNTPLDSNKQIDLSDFVNYSGAKVVSLGGWCGPAVGIMNIKFPGGKVSYPFDWLHVSVEAINRLIRNNFEDYFPNNYRCTKSNIEWRNKEKAIGLSVAYKKCFTNDKQDVVFVHSDVNNEIERNKLKNRCDRFMDMLKKDSVVFIRTITHLDYAVELVQIELLKETLNEFYPQLQYKFVLIFHDQDIGTKQLDPIDAKTMVWAVDGIVGWDKEYQDHLYHNYRKIIEFSLEESNWPPKTDIKNHTLVNHREHWYM